MKKILFILLVSFSISLNAQDKSYWTCFNFAVENQSDGEELVNAVDLLFNSEEMSQMPFTVFMFEMEFVNSTTNYTHQICFLAPNADYFKGWGNDGPGEFAESMLVNKIFESVAKPVSNILASPLIFDPSKAGGYEYSNIWSFNVKDVAKFAALASEFIAVNSNNFDGVIELHETISGAEDGVTHIMVARSNNLGDWLRGREAVLANPKSRNWFENSSKYGTLINSSAGKTLKVYPGSN
tara:strand:+ start:75 stop:791 length:717 start_codon:yes stop_codon:yes gene_type:complete